MCNYTLKQEKCVVNEIDIDGVPRNLHSNWGGTGRAAD